MADGQLLHLAPQLQDLLPLTSHQVTHHRQVRLSGVLQVTTNSQFGALLAKRLIMWNLLYGGNTYIR